MFELRAFRPREAAVLDLRHDGFAGGFADEIELKAGFPVTGGTGVLVPAVVREHRRGMIVQEFLLLGTVVTLPPGAVRGKNLVPETHRRVIDGEARPFAGARTFAERNLPMQNRNIRQVLAAAASSSCNSADRLVKLSSTA